ncbi:MAG: hypothetical protein BGO12_20255 [Verrucomicrobia bacterium 61-8]|nr:hypothetical protein [Verrucomicrobiota bacterium]OJV03699.1 MAG: hypothetical protein BGO12_20255 [Verrucomicrobia bacterium 61-8]
MKTTHTLAAAALAGLLTGTTVSYAASTSSTGAGVKISTLADKGTHSCKGQNACKGQGGCKGSDNGCKGQNSCKGKGGCATDGSKH